MIRAPNQPQQLTEDEWRSVLDRRVPVFSGSLSRDEACRRWRNNQPGFDGVGVWFANARGLRVEQGPRVCRHRDTPRHRPALAPSAWWTAGSATSAVPPTNVAETLASREQFVKYQRRPTLGDDLRRLRDGTKLTIVHHRSIASHSFRYARLASLCLVRTPDSGLANARISLNVGANGVDCRGHNSHRSPQLWRP